MSESISRSGLSEMIAAETGQSVTASEQMLNAALSIITKQLTEGKVLTLTGFGTFKTRTQAARTGRNPTTGAEIQIPERTVVSFKAGKNLRQAVNS